jgi:hypothetical protein
VDEVIIDPQTGEPFQISAHSSAASTSPGIDLNFDLPSRQLGEKTKLAAGLTAGYAWGASGSSRSMINGRLNLMHRLGPADYVRLGYTYASAPSGLQPSMFTYGQQRLRLDGAFGLKDWRVRLNASRELDGSRLFGSIYMSRALPLGTDALGKPLWSIALAHVFSHLEEYRYASSRAALRRRFGRYRVSLCYSPQGYGIRDSRPWVSTYGYGYTYASGRKVWIEFSAAGY